MSVSFVVTVFNKRAHLEQVLPALAAEARAVDGEIVLVDDGSTDGSREALAAFVAGRANARLHAQPNGGVAAATNAGLALARLRFVRLVDGDDVVTPGSTRALIEASLSVNAALAFGRIVHGGSALALPVQEAGSAVRLVRDPARAMLRATPFNPSVTLAPRDFAQAALPLPTFVRTAQDFSYGLRLARFGPFCAIDAVCAIAPSEAAARLSFSDRRQHRDMALIAAALCPEWRPSLQRYAVARMARRAARFLRAHAPHHRGERAEMRALTWAARLGWPLDAAQSLARIAAIHADLGYARAPPP